jgi:hypothetical protein
LRFLRQGFCLPPVLRRLWRESREIPAERTAGIGKKLVSDARRAKSMASVVHRRRLPRDAGDAPRARGGDRARYP